ncbi:hypothetical protein QR680_016454 [Steinernema hermaphroditum]|uniref:Uncharacterized protein n=1 Tax=Steinernema hermaphroditum TaxID=289476 RepID=A0AA39LML5_9BILA|nr:hypothetical protein QR680_016454 [Steinernema hermaphroditum]
MRLVFDREELVATFVQSTVDKNFQDCKLLVDAFHFEGVLVCQFVGGTESTLPELLVDGSSLVTWIPELDEFDGFL